VSKLVTPFGFGSTTSDVLPGVDLAGKTALVTGANSGIGHETARAPASAGAAVVVAARRDRAGSDAATQIAASTGNPHLSRILLNLADHHPLRPNLGGRPDLSQRTDLAEDLSRRQDTA